jgi:deoxyribodipyrimidine photo-lyase
VRKEPAGNNYIDFALSCLAELRAELAARGLPLVVRVGSVVSVLAQRHQAQAFAHLLSHKETGSGWSYTRDKKLRKA